MKDFREEPQFNNKDQAELAKKFDEIFGDMYADIKYTPPPLHYIDNAGNRKTYIYKPKK